MHAHRSSAVPQPVHRTPGRASAETRAPDARGRGRCVAARIAVRAWPLIVALLLLAAAPIALADGLMVLRPVPGFPHPEALAVQYHDVHITIRDQVGSVQIDQVFRNLNDRRVEGDYIFPIPEGAAVSDFVLYVDGRPLHAEAMDAQQALRVYQELVRETRDPALLEYAGREMFRARVHPFEPRGSRRVALTYEQVVEREGGLYRFVYPLSTEKFSSRALERAVVTLELEADRPIRNAYCPSHAVDIEYLGKQRLRMTWEENGTRPDRDLVFYYSLAEGPMDIRVVPYRPARGEDGYFMLLASPGMDDELPVVPKDVIFVVDRSGSMAGDKFKQARRALRHCLEHLNSDDRFNVIAFSSSVEAFADELRPARDRDVREARRFVDGLEAGGSTNIFEALREALGSRFDNERPAFVVFVTDGLPTAGEVDPERILEMVADRNRGGGLDSERDGWRGWRGWHGARIFTFGVGYDVNAVLLDLLAEENAGRPAYVRPGEDLDGRVAGFYDQIADPVMTDVELDIEGGRIRDLQPVRVPDIFRGSQLVLFGRYRGDGPATFSLTGTVAGRRRTFTAQVDLPEYEHRDGFVGRLWATRKVGALLREVRLRGESAELVDEIRDLGLQFGIVTPYTSFLVDEDARGPLMAGEEVRVMREGGRPTAHRRESLGGYALSAPSPGDPAQDAGGGSQSAGAGATWGSLQSVYDAPIQARKKLLQTTGGGLGVALSDEVESLASASSERDRDAALGVRHVAGRTFHRVDGVWQEVGFTPGTATIATDMGSDAYFELLGQHPEVGPILSLGERVIFQIDGHWYETRPMP
jgi:hypothetical protein